MSSRQRVKPGVSCRHPDYIHSSPSTPHVPIFISTVPTGSEPFYDRLLADSDDDSDGDSDDDFGKIIGNTINDPFDLQKMSQNFIKSIDGSVWDHQSNSG